ncbi:MAG: family 16 glycosylhydrolase [Bacteroidales bacterium]|jgi:beta-glucanase (GH16 family)|nr:family 16 glycosylhydrolase [Bacteroidales bacterium]
MKIVSTLLICILALNLGAQNLLLNPSFENSSAPWLLKQGACIRSSNAHSGQHALQINANDTALFRLKNLEPHTTYEIGAWLQSTDGKPMKISIKESGDNEKETLSSSTSYTYVTLQFTTGPKHKTALIEISGGNGYADDISLTRHADFKDSYDLIWTDDFNNAGALDSNKWRFENGFVRNKELQWYQQENAFCEDGCLVIEARREQRPNPNYDKSADNWTQKRKDIHYTSASIISKGQFDFKYGRMEVRAKITNKPGTWPAIWTLGKKGEWPSNGEVDIMENYEGKILANFAWGTDTQWTAKWDSKAIQADSMPPLWFEQFHLWQLVWDEDRMSIYLDQELLNEVKLANTINGSFNCEGKNPFQQAHYILLNLAIGGNAGDPSSTVFPTRYLVDYVHIYQKK